ncbi:uncharacterized protein N0V89_003764 [Didymosphaeria variabile]|uniref:Pinin/SDK/MemA protein domain-containing protein n=1 Tax=Didymosphaeria variabile TaxID=1932322 RepID=A0A9W8XNM7_9PLEO|nr:uncharacterized protein N0V89_003764 [Didymosphaeria variabile]KAJ4355744.1 hypothetical protein N0V89_003764 [Didymosphaeria variabile]
MDGIASAVVLPAQDVDSPPPTAPSPTGTKRRHSSISEQDAKRARLNGNDSPTHRRESVGSTKAAAPPKGRERGRERRLFGAALGALSQNSATAGQKRRIEIEKRQRAQRKQEEEESEQRKQERQTKRKAQRWREHRHFEKDSLRIRHDNLLAMAHFLQTRTEPRLYYKPWETTTEEDDRIRDQFAEAHDIIRREREDFEAAQRRYAERAQDASGDVLLVDDAEDIHTGKGYNATTPPKPAAANGPPTNGSDLSSKTPERNDDHARTRADALTSVEQSSTAGHERMTDDTGKEAVDDHGEEVVEAAEDTVMY